MDVMKRVSRFSTNAGLLGLFLLGFSFQAQALIVDIDLDATSGVQVLTDSYATSDSHVMPVLQTPSTLPRSRATAQATVLHEHEEMAPVCLVQALRGVEPIPQQQPLYRASPLKMMKPSVRAYHFSSILRMAVSEQTAAFRRNKDPPTCSSLASNKV